MPFTKYLYSEQRMNPELTTTCEKPKKCMLVVIIGPSGWFQQQSNADRSD